MVLRGTPRESHRVSESVVQAPPDPSERGSVWNRCRFHPWAGGSRFLWEVYFQSLLCLIVLCKQSQDIEASAQIQPLPQPSLPPAAPIPAPQGTPSVEELIQQSQWNLQQQEQHLLAMRQVGLS